MDSRETLEQAIARIAGKYFGDELEHTAKAALREMADFQRERDAKLVEGMTPRKSSGITEYIEADFAIKIAAAIREGGSRG